MLAQEIADPKFDDKLVQACKHIDGYYHIEVVDHLKCRLTVESYHLEEKEEAIVMLNPSKLWIDSIEAVVK